MNNVTMDRFEICVAMLVRHVISIRGHVMKHSAVICLIAILLILPLRVSCAPLTIVAGSDSGTDGVDPVNVLADHAKRQGRISVNAGLLHSGTMDSAGSRYEMGLFDDYGVVVEFSKVIQDNGAFTWIGRPADDEGQVLFVLNENEVHARIDVGLRQFYIEGPMERATVTEIDPASFIAMEALPDTLESTDVGGLLPKNAKQLPASASPDKTVDALILYTAAAQAAVGGDVNSPHAPTGFAANLVADMNLAFANNGVNAAVRVVGYEQNIFIEPNIMDGNAWKDALTKLRAGNGEFVSVPGLRAAYAADIVVLLVAPNSNNTACGIGTAWDTKNAFAGNAFAVVNVVCGAGDRNFTHEVGHILGGRHDDDNKINLPFTYNFGFANYNPALRTIMAYGLYVGLTCTIDACPRINYWSDPTKIYSGVTIGSSTRDMKTTLVNTVASIAAYKAAASIVSPASLQSADANVCNYPTWPPPSTIVRTYFSWVPAAGNTIGWYELQSSANSNFSPASLAYSGNAGGAMVGAPPSYARVRACNAGGCSAYKPVTFHVSPPSC